jgi:glutamate 5-kinase
METDFRANLKDKQRIVIKIGSSSLIHPETGDMDYLKCEKLVRAISDLKNQGKDVVLVSSGSIAVGYRALGLNKKPELLPMKQACSAVGQGQLMMLYQKLFLEYNHKSAQVLLTFDVITSDERRKNAENTLKQLIDLDIIPVVNENDTVATDEINFGDNDTLSAIVATLINADLLILITDIDGFYTDDPAKNPNAKRLSVVTKIDDKLKGMAKRSTSKVGTGGMYTKVSAARIVTKTGADMVICDSDDLTKLRDIINGEDIGTLFVENENDEINITDYIVNKKYMK